VSIPFSALCVKLFDFNFDGECWEGLFAPAISYAEKVSVRRYFLCRVPAARFARNRVVGHRTNTLHFASLLSAEQ
jgi:hypothetical protein